MGLLGTIAKAVGGAAVEGVIETACDQFEQFAKGVGVGKTHTWSYTFRWKGKSLGTISAKVKKTRANLILTISGRPFKIALSGISEACVIAVHGALALI